MTSLILLQHVVPDYRVKFYNLLEKQYGEGFELISGYEPEDLSQQKARELVNYTEIKCYTWQRDRMVFQTGMWCKLLKAERVVLNLNPRNLSVWGALFLRKMLGKKTVLWGHAWPIAGKYSRSDKLRQMMRLLADGIICYTKTQADELKEKMPKMQIGYAPNAVFYQDEMQSANDKIGNNIIYVGRLIPSKKPEIAIRAFHHAVKKLPNDTKLVFVGDGSERMKLENLVKELELTERVEFKGHIGDYDRLQKLYAQSLVSISPGYVGLSITQSFGFGVPMIISCNETHSPEIECAIEGENALFFETDNAEDFGKVMQSVFQKRDFWVKKRPEIQQFCRENYSVEAMVKGFLEVVYQK